MRDVAVYVAIPSNRDWKVQFGSSLTGLLFHCMRSGLSTAKLVNFHINNMAGASLLSRAREKALQEATAMGFTHILFIDDDMAFPQNVLDRLMAHDLPFVAANYAAKIPGRTKSVCFDAEGKNINSAQRTGLEEVAFVGAGMMLVDLAAANKIASPRFQVLWNEEAQDYIGEDRYFCDALKATGTPLMVDHDISMDVWHIGDFPYSFDNEATIAKYHGTVAKII